MYKLDLGKVPEIKLSTSSGSSKKQENSSKTSTSASLTSLSKAFDCVDHDKLRKILQEIGITNHLTCLLRNLYAGQETTVRTRHGTMGWFKTGKKKYVKAVYCNPAYLTYMQSASCEMPGWINHRLESRLPGGISATSDMWMIPL